MGEMADYTNEQQANSLEDLLDYQSGKISKLEAIEKGILDENGLSENNEPDLWGVHDISSLEQELVRCERDLLMTRNNKPVTTARKIVKVWRTKLGEKIRICDMTDTHLLNADRYLKRLAAGILQSLPYPAFNGEIAQESAEREYDRLQNMDIDELTEELFPNHFDILEEIERRNLTRLQDN